MRLHRIGRLGLAALAGTVLLAGTASASHWRFGHTTWRRVSGNTVEVTVLEGYRSSFIGSNTYTWGDGTGGFSTSGATTIATGTDLVGESFTIRRTVVQHTYAANGPYLISFQSCCRIGSIVNPSSGQRMECKVDLSNGNLGSPVSSIPVILQMAQGGVNTIPLAISDPDGTPFTCRMATPSESLINSVAAAGGHQLTVSPDCILSWDTSGTSVGQKYAAQVAIIENSTPPPPPGGPVLDPATEIRFVVGHADCSGAETFAFSINGTTVHSSASDGTCSCASAPHVVTITNPVDLALADYTQPTMVFDLTDPQTNILLAYARVEIDRQSGTTETLVFVDFAGGNGADRSPCNTAQWTGTSSFTAQAIAPPPPPSDGRVALDFIIEIVDGTINTPPSCSGDTGNFVVAAGSLLSLNFTGTDADGDALTVNDLGLPIGATLTPAAGTSQASPANATFDWTPTAADSGAHAVTVTFQDPGGLQSFCSFSITVLDNRPPTCTVLSTSGNIATVGVAYFAEVLGDDPDGDDLTFSASGLPGATLTNHGPSPTGSTTVLEWTPMAGDAGGAFVGVITVTDTSGASVDCTFNIDAVNVPPDAVCAATVSSTGAAETSPGVFECETPDGTAIVFDGSGSSDPDGDALSYRWDIDGSVYMGAATVTHTVAADGGSVTGTLTVMDGRGGVDSCSVTVLVEDTTAPEVECSVDTLMLWPPNHKMRTIVLTVSGSDACTSTADLVMASVVVSSDEPDNANGLGDGNTTGDVDGQDGFSSPAVLTSVPVYDAASDTFKMTIQLRAERDGTMDGRCYTIVSTVVDTAGNPATTTCCVAVPHDQRKAK